VLAQRASTVVGLSEAGQRVLVELATSGDLARHLRRVRRELSVRRTMMVGTLRAGDIQVPGDDAGAHLVIPLSHAQQERRLVAAARARGLLIDPLARHQEPPALRHGLLVGYTIGSRGDLAAATRTLVDLIAAAARPG
jgi:GntR family transcriptional regulator / MocR family aminotransferase